MEDGILGAGNNIKYYYCGLVAILPLEMHLYGMLLGHILGLQL